MGALSRRLSQGLSRTFRLSSAAPSGAASGGGGRSSWASVRAAAAFASKLQARATSSDADLGAGALGGGGGGGGPGGGAAGGDVVKIDTKGRALDPSGAAADSCADTPSPPEPNSPACIASGRCVCYRILLVAG